MIKTGRGKGNMTISKVFTEKKPITAKTIIDKALSYIGTYDGGNKPRAARQGTLCKAWCRAGHRR